MGQGTRNPRQNANDGASTRPFRSPSVTAESGSNRGRPLAGHNVPPPRDGVNAPIRVMESVAAHALTPGATLGHRR
jgi:hypothetical protein